MPSHAHTQLLGVWANLAYINKRPFSLLLPSSKYYAYIAAYVLMSHILVLLHNRGSLHIDHITLMHSAAAILFWFF